MKQKNPVRLIAGVLLAAAGAVGSVMTRAAAIAEGASDGSKAVFALFLITVLLGIVLAFLGVRDLTRPGSGEKQTDTKTLALAAMFAALCYIGFSFFKIDIPVGTEKTAFHLGNVFCVLGALLLGGMWGGMAGAVGMTIADLTTGYLTSAPKTFLLKLCIGLIVGLVAHKIFRISREQPGKRVLAGAAVASLAGMAFNVVADPLVGYFYKMWILGIPQEIANAWAKIGAVTTLVNAVVAVVAATVFYMALRPALKHARLFPAMR